MKPREMSPTVIAALFIVLLIATTIVVCVLLAVGYVPMTGWSHNARHERLWGTFFGFASGLTVGGGMMLLAWGPRSRKGE